MRRVEVVSCCMLVVLLQCASRYYAAGYPSTTGAAASSRATLTLQGLMDYYWNHDPQDKTIGFFFACGQVGGQGKPANWKKCSCNNGGSCLNCYRWWDAVAMESLASYGLYTNSSSNAEVPDVVFKHSPYNANWDGLNSYTFVDDFVWYGIAYLRVYDWLQDGKWLDRSLAIYKWAWKYGWDDSCGGFWWSTWPNQHFKDSITNMEMLHFSAKLALMFFKESDYLQDAVKVWDWVFSFDDGHGLMTDMNLVSTGAIPEKCCNSSVNNPSKKCHNSKLSGTSYNQGLLLSSAGYLYVLTRDHKYLDAGLKVLNAVLVNYTTTEGILVDEMRSYQTYVDRCWAGRDPGGDWYSFNGIFMLHLSYFTEVMYVYHALSYVPLSRIKNFVQTTSDAAWNRSALWPPFDNKNDACNTGHSNTKQSKSPKFHWWWGNQETKQVMPPDPNLYLKKTQLRCVGNNTQLWDGDTISEDKCEKRCNKDKNCSKYLFATDAYHCWTWSFSRTDHICNQTDSNFNVGVKRPVGHATCKDHCGSHVPQQVADGACYCDANCTRHLDCCLDYAEECVKETYLSCKGLCNKAHAQAIPGGGYCWCFDGCNPNFTDNSSMGSCCPDYPEQCLSVKMPDCLDARSQGSALNLFLAHMKISTL